jgi:integrase
LCSICGVFVSQGHTGAAVALCVAFDGMLRTGEMLNVKASDVVISADSLTAVVSLGLTKGGKRRGVEETVVLDDPLVVSLLTVLLTSRKGGQKLIPLSQAKFRHMFAEALKKLDLEEIGFKPYSIRRGGATWYLNATGSMSKVCVKGRWSSEKCARIYVNDGLTTLAKLAFSRKANKLCAKYRSSFLRLIK